jgi:hypothetical protein
MAGGQGRALTVTKSPQERKRRRRAAVRLTHCENFHIMETRPFGPFGKRPVFE